MKPLKIGGTTRLCLFAKRDIDAEEELRYDYGIDDLPWRKVRYSCISNISEWQKIVNILLYILMTSKVLDLIVTTLASLVLTTFMCVIVLGLVTWS